MTLFSFTQCVSVVKYVSGSSFFAPSFRALADLPLTPPYLCTLPLPSRPSLSSTLNTEAP